MQSLFDEFKQLSYEQKLEYFHSSFGIIPFPFPKVDMDISWFDDGSRLKILTDNLLGEIKNRHIYGRCFTEGENTLVFDIKPQSQIHRIQYNTFLLSLFSSDMYATPFQIPHGYLETADEYKSFLIAKRWRVQTILEEAKQYLQGRNFRTDLKLQFVKVFYSGFASFRSKQGINLRIRHKFVELYLYSQGCTTAKYLNHLHNLIEEVNAVYRDKF